MARSVPQRIHTSAAVTVTVVCAALISACGPSPRPPARTPATPDARSGVPATGGGPAGGGGAGDVSYALSAPQVAAGYSQGQPPADLVQKVNGDTQHIAPRLGVSGTPVHAFYDDRADGAWIFYTGVTGTGFDPDRLHGILDQAPAVHDDGAGDRFSTSALDADPGPHGGRAICNTVLVRNAMLTTAVTTCSWFTPTTAAGITVVLKGDGTNTKVGFTAADVAPVMRAVRADVEQPQQLRSGSGTGSRSGSS
ncbi:hypothetical protein [Streptomyces sp. NPDC054765]